jgi:anti-anti-sigma factor
LASSAPARSRIDLWQVMLIDSLGVGALVGCHRTAAAQGVRLVLANPTATVHRQLVVSGLIEKFGSPEYSWAPPP